MASRNYGQACSVARFLDQLGSRWTLLIIRDLLIGPRRFKDLLASMPSIGNNLLADRLRELSQEGIVEKVAAPGSNASTYVLTEKGNALEPVILAMASWGLHHLHEEPSEQEKSRPDLLVVAFRAVFQSEHAKGVHETYEFRIDETIFFAEIDDGNLRTGLGTATRPAFVFTTDSATFDKIASGTMDVIDAQERCLLEISGDQDAYARCAQIFSG
jgi:DNA-binding HxlR family transcriptional regulator